MGNKRSGIYLALCYQAQDFLTITAIYSTRLENEILAIHIRKRKHLGLIIHSNNSNDGIRTGTLPCQLESIRTTSYFHHHIGSAMQTLLLDEGFAIFRFYHKNLRIMFLDKCSSGF